MSDVTAKLQAKIEEIQQQCADEILEIEARYEEQITLLEATIRLFNDESPRASVSRGTATPTSSETSRPKRKAKSPSTSKREAAPRKPKASESTTDANSAGVTKRAAIEEAIRAVEGNFTRTDIAAYLEQHFPDLAEEITTPLISNTLLNLKGKLVECIKESSGGVPSTYRRISKNGKA